MDNANLALSPKELAHQLAMLWVEAVLSGKRQPITKSSVWLRNTLPRITEPLKSWVADLHRPLVAREDRVQRHRCYSCNQNESQLLHPSSPPFLVALCNIIINPKFGIVNI